METLMNRTLMDSQISAEWSTPWSPETSLRAFLHVVFKRKRQILGFLAITVALAGAFTVLWPATYQASAKILVKMGRENIYVPTLPTQDKTGPVVVPNHPDQVNSEIAILTSDYLARKVVATIGPGVLYPDLHTSTLGAFIGSLFMKRGRDPDDTTQQAVFRFQDNLQVTGVKDTDTVTVSFTHHDPQMAAKVVNTLIRFYLERHLHVHQSPNSYAFFVRQADIARKQLAAAEAKLSRFMNQKAVSSPREQRSLLLKQQGDVRAALSQTMSEEAEIESRLVRFRRELADIPKTILMDEEIDNGPTVIAGLQTHLVELQLKERELLGKYSDGSRQVQNVREEIALVQGKLREQMRKRYAKKRVGANPLYQGFLTEMKRAEVELQAVEARKAIQSAQLDEYTARLDELNQAALTFNNLQQQLDVESQNYRLYQTKLEEARVSNAMDKDEISNISVFDPAQPPLYAVSPQPLLNMVISVLLGLVGGLGMAFLREYFDDSLDRREEVETDLQLPVLASIEDFSRARVASASGVAR
jgi:protein tyrosine kinase modulator